MNNLEHMDDILINFNDSYDPHRSNMDGCFSVLQATMKTLAFCGILFG
jgi:hypothetical protein